ncbi:peptidoglycan DD-metalloendopeptidase family protein [Bifidobacterium sp. ESL0763]|uniref:M23 family metallopeptidase n=1 Tax=Bifidobacterium sp. ESL0763 TaxID=2983227 RepID=UPI0023F64471|nr:peptidoglycan DD-metalloendopeptidase family protein [Bifidobacterium sp. ESL0763]MDF7663769.1 peptidoglycan DD-metalloendopeptidase family protein [Bifidobacterium sp. ESL0763]
MNDVEERRRWRARRWRERQWLRRWSQMTAVMLAAVLAFALLLVEVGADAGAEAMPAVGMDAVANPIGSNRYPALTTQAVLTESAVDGSGAIADDGQVHDAREPCVDGTALAPGVTPAATTGEADCKAQFFWPVHPAVVIRRFDAPANRWGPGHRGVDLAAPEGTPLTAPTSGIISFVGLVAEKSVVSIRHGRLTLTFEPAQTVLPPGTPLVKGAPFATVAGISDHCTAICVHWGVKDSRRNYTDPAHKVRKEKIVLKELDP